MKDVRALFAAEGFEGSLEVEGPDSLPDNGERHVVFIDLGFVGWVEEGRGFDLRFVWLRRVDAHRVVRGFLAEADLLGRGLLADFDGSVELCRVCSETM